MLSSELGFAPLLLLLLPCALGGGVTGAGHPSLSLSIRLPFSISGKQPIRAPSGAEPRRWSGTPKGGTAFPVPEEGFLWHPARPTTYLSVTRAEMW